MPSPIDHYGREYEAYLRGPVGLNAFAYGTVDAYRGGVQHLGLLASVPEPSDAALSDFGIQQGGGFTVEIADEPDTSDWNWLWEDGSRITLESADGLVILEY